MVEFPVKTYTKKISISDEVSRDFGTPMVAFLRNAKDTNEFFYTTVIIELAKKECTYVQSYSPENVALLRESGFQDAIERITYANPHGAIQTETPGKFYVFVEQANFYFLIDIHTKTMRAYLSHDLQVEGAIISKLGSTCYKGDDDPEYFYFSAIGKNSDTGLDTLFFLKSNLDMSEVTVLSSTPRPQRLRPAHVARKFKGHLFCTEFESIRCKLDNSDQVFETQRDLALYIYKDSFREFCAKVGLHYTDELFNEHVVFNWDLHQIKMSTAFREFCGVKGSSWLDICRASKKYTFSQLAGSFSVLNLKDGSTTRYETSSAPTAHIEFDVKNDTVYVSSHNYLRTIHGLYYIGPAFIDKYTFVDGKATHVGAFTESTGYRYPNHRIFHYEGKAYLCVIGHPNRLFFVDAETLQVVYHHDIHNDVLSNQSDIANMLNTTNAGKVQPIAFEVSSSGKYVCLIWKKHVTFFSFPDRKFTEVIEVVPDEKLGNGVSLDDFYLTTVHLTPLV